IGEGANSDGDVTGKALALPVNRGATGRTEVEAERVPAVGRARPLSGFPREGDLFATKARLVADHGAGAALARQAVTHRDARGLALDGEVELAAAAGGAASSHGTAPVSRCGAHSSASWSGATIHPSMMVASIHRCSRETAVRVVG